MCRRFALGYRHGPDARPACQRMTFSRSIGPSGGFFCSTASDLVRFGHLFLHDGQSLEGRQVLSRAAVRAMQGREVAVPPTLLADWWGLGPYGKVWDGVEVMGHSGTTQSGSSYLLWAVERDFAVATTVNTPAFGYPFAAHIFRELFPAVADIVVPQPARPPRDVNVDPSPLVGTYAMSGLTLIVSGNAAGLVIEGSSDIPGVDREITRAPLIPLSPRTFLPTNPAIDGRRGWALHFVGPADEPATHLINGFFALRRIAS